MRAEQLLAELRQRGVLLSADNGEIVVQAQPGSMPADLIDQLRDSKLAILDLLRRERVTYPLSDIQRAYIIGRRLSGDIGNVGCHFYYEFDGESADVERLSDAWNAVIERHICLRSTVASDMTAMICEHRGRFEIAVADLRDSSAVVVETALASRRESMSHRLYDPHSWPLFDIQATLLPGDRTRLHLSLDLVAVDAISIVQLMREWRQNYDRAPPPSSPSSYDEYARRAAKLEQSEQFAAARQYWLDRLAAIAPAPALPLVCPPQQIGQPRFHRRAGVLAVDQWSALKRRAGEAGLTPTALLCAAFAEVLRRWTGQDQFTLTLTLFNRLPLVPHVESMIGDFTSTLLLSVPCSEDKFVASAHALQKRLQEDMRHRLFSGVRVMRELQGNATQPVRMPVVFTSLLAHQNNRGSEAGLGVDWLGERVFGISQTPQVWLDHQVAEDRGALLFTWDAVEALFPPGLLDAMFAAYSDLLSRLAAGTDVFEAAHPVRLPDDQVKRREDYNASTEAEEPGLLQDRFLSRAARTPHKAAVICPSATLSYDAVRRRANAVATRLRSFEIGPGDLVAVVMVKGWEQVVGAFGILFTGAAFLPVDATLPQARIAAMLKIGRVRVALTQADPAPSIAWPEGITPLVVDDSSADGLPLPKVAVRPTDLAYVIYTSGSAGAPKGVMIEHRAAVNTIADINRRFAIGSEDSVLGLSNLSFDLAIYDVFGVLAAGGALVLPDPSRLRDPGHWLSLMHNHRVTVWNSVPMLMQMLVEHTRGRVDRLPGSLRLTMLSGDWIPLDLPDAIRDLASGVNVVSLGGATEGSIWSILFPVEDIDPTWRSIPYGIPMANQRMHVYDGRMQPSPEWVEGDLHIGGTGLARGYWDDAEKTAGQFITHPDTGERLYRTGDKARFVPHGYLEFLGRRDFQVKIRGHRVEIGEIEAALRAHPLVQDAVVVADAGAKPPALLGYVVPARLPDLSSRDVGAAPWRDRPMMSAGVPRMPGEAAPSLAPFLQETQLLERESTDAIAGALHALGLFRVAGEARTLDDIMVQGGVHERFRGLIARWLRILTDDRALTCDEAERYHCPMPLGRDAAARLGGSAPAPSPLIEYFDSCRRHLTELVRGDVSPLALLFPGGDWRLAEALYEHNPIARLVNAQAARAVQDLVAGTTGEIRVLELGGGVGSATSSILPVLPPGRTHYLFTDVTPFFREGIKRKFEQFGFLEYGVVDALRDPLSQGLLPYGFDLIIAANVMHNAEVPATALARLRPLLVPGGVLLLIEATRNTRSHAVTVGFMDGLHDAVGEDRPFLSLRSWIAALEAAGFGDVTAGRDNKDGGSHLGLDLILARAGPPSAAERQVAFGTAGESLDAGSLGNHLARLLPAHMLPRDIVVLDGFPLTANGKLDRSALPAPAGNVVRQEASRRFTAAEDLVADAWRTVLNRREVGLHDNFFDLGGDSLLMIQLQQSLCERLARDIPIVDLFAHPTVASMAAGLDGAEEHRRRQELSRIEQRVTQRRAATLRRREAYRDGAS